jgi:hypothetical protein
MSIPAERVLPAGALVLVIDHSGSMAQPMPKDRFVIKQDVANESAILALKTLMRGDLFGVVAFDSTPKWIIDLAENRDPLWAIGKIRDIIPAGGTNIGPALDLAATAMTKLSPQSTPIRRILLLTDGRSDPYNYDPIVQRITSQGIVLSCVAVGADADRTLLERLAIAGRGRAYIADDPQQLRQIFIREARTLRRSLIHEPEDGVALTNESPGDAVLGSIGDAVASNRLSGIVLTSRKKDPNARVVLSADNRYRDPVLAITQAGLGRTAVFAGDATTRWGSAWVASGQFDSFWTQLLRGVCRPAQSNEYQLTMTPEDGKLRLVVEALDADGAAQSFLSFVGRVARSGDPTSAQDVELSQTGAGRYEAIVSAAEAGNYVAGIQSHAPDGSRGTIIGGAVVNDSAEFRDLSSNDAVLTEIAVRSGGRILSGFDGSSAGKVFSREGLHRSASTTPAWDQLLMGLMALVLADVAVRRIAWDRLSFHRAVAVGVAMIRVRTASPRVETRESLEALRRVRQRKATVMDDEAESVDTSGLAADTPRSGVATDSMGQLLKAKDRARSQRNL